MTAVFGTTIVFNACNGDYAVACNGVVTQVGVKKVIRVTIPNIGNVRAVDDDCCHFLVIHGNRIAEVQLASINSTVLTIDQWHHNGTVRPRSNS